jgi:hypothetical protein
MFALLNQALIVQVELTITAAMAYVERAVRTNGNSDSTFFSTYLMHVTTQALATLLGLSALNYLPAPGTLNSKPASPGFSGLRGLRL